MIVQQRIVRSLDDDIRLTVRAHRNGCRVLRQGEARHK